VLEAMEQQAYALGRREKVKSEIPFFATFQCSATQNGAMDRQTLPKV
jgi:hypothetical protein